MSSVRFVFGVHNHQPVGNFDFVFREAFEKSYRPFIDVAKDFPDIALSFHFSGPLLEWLDANEPGYLDQVASMVSRGNVEILSGGFYEPILAVIPEKDKIGQIRKLNAYIKDRFNYDANGLWLTERIWEPHLAKPIRDAGIEYVAVDDYHFFSAGKKEEDLTGYYLTEEENKMLGVFPISQRLRYAIPFLEPDEAIALLRQASELGSDVTMTMIDDGEKFGLWPGTNKTCYGKHDWLRRFFTALSENSDWLKTSTMSDAFTEVAAKGRIYLPTASYFEMSEWSLPSTAGEAFSHLVHDMDERGELDSNKPFIRGGMWRNFFIKYDESNWMHKRTMELSERVAETKASGEVLDNLWRSQCNCAYWHGVFGGLYLPHLRHAIFERLIAAEKLINPVTAGVRIIKRDVDLDGHDEIEFVTPQVRGFLTSAGGALRELDVLGANFNLMNTLQRRHESYHYKLREATTSRDESASIHDTAIATENGLERLLVDDKAPRYSLLDHFYPAGTTPEELVLGLATDEGNLATRIYSCSIEDDTITAVGEGLVGKVPVRLSKQIVAHGDELDISITIENMGESNLDATYTPEFNFSLLGGHTPDRYYLVNGEQPEDGHMDSVGVLDDVKSLSLLSEWEGVGVDLRFPEAMVIWRYPVETVSLSERGFERVYQESVVHPVIALQLEPGGTKIISMALCAKDLPDQRKYTPI